MRCAGDGHTLFLCPSLAQLIKMENHSDLVSPVQRPRAQVSLVAGPGARESISARRPLVVCTRSKLLIPQSTVLLGLTPPTHPSASPHRATVVL